MQEFRPMSVSDILDTTFRLYRERFVAFFLISLMVYVPYTLLITLITPTPSPGAPAANPFATPSRGAPAPATPKLDPMTAVAGGLGVFLFACILLPLCSAALTINISSAYIGKELSAGASYQLALPRLAALVGTQILAGLMVILGIPLLIIGAVIFAFWFYVVAPVVILEGVAGPKALGRSRELMRGNIGKAFLVGLLAGIIAGIIALIAGIVIGLVPWPHPILAALAQSLVSAAVLPISVAPIVLLYYDLRIRKEAFDLQMLSTAMAQPAM
jgi:hypothetical protein